jgi:sugar diacid utilization regulator
MAQRRTTRGTADARHDAAAASHSLVAALLGARPIQDLLARLHGILQTPVAVIDRRGDLVAGYPSRVEWPVEHIVQAEVDEAGMTQSGHFVQPVDVDGEPVAVLCTQGEPRDRALVDIAGALIGVEMSRRNAELRGRRALLAQVLEDIFDGVLSRREAHDRLSRYGFDPGHPHRVIVGRADCTEQRLRSFPWNLHALVAERGDPYLRAVLGDHVVLIAPTESSAQLASLCHAFLSQLGGNVRVGVGNAQTGALGLRLSYFEARAASHGGDGIHEYGPRDLTAVLVTAALDAGAPVYELGRQALTPLIEHDEHNGTDLVRTLQTYLEAGCSTPETTARMFIHRNTLRYRLKLIEKLLDRRLDTPAARMHLWLAATCWSIGPDHDLTTLWGQR